MIDDKSYWKGEYVNKFQLKLRFEQTQNKETGEQVKKG